MLEEYKSRQIGKTVEILLENRSDGMWHGTTGNYLKASVDNPPLFSTRGQLVSGVLSRTKDGLIVSC